MSVIRRRGGDRSLPSYDEALTRNRDLCNVARGWADLAAAVKEHGGLLSTAEACLRFGVSRQRLNALWVGSGGVGRLRVKVYVPDAGWRWAWSVKGLTKRRKAGVCQ